MEKSKLYPRTYFTSNHISHFLETVANANSDRPVSFYYLTRGDESWNFDTEQEYLAEYTKDHDHSFIKRAYDKLTIKIRYIKNNYTDITIEAPTIKEVEKTFELFEKLYTTALKQKV